MGALGVVALAVLLGMFALRDKRPRPAPPRRKNQSRGDPIPAHRTRDEASPPLPPPLVAGPRLRKPSEPDAGKRLDETSLMAKLHDLAASDPPLSLQLARERSPASR